jgi:hypothetical protein
MRWSVSSRSGSGKNALTSCASAPEAGAQNIRSAEALNRVTFPSASKATIASIADPTISEKRAS